MQSWENYKKTMQVEDNLWLAAKDGDVERINAFLKEGADINAKDHRGYSPLMLACYAGHDDAASRLIANGADVNSADSAGNTILMGVCFKGYEHIAHILLAEKADITLLNHGGQNAYAIAENFGRIALMQLLKA